MMKKDYIEVFVYSTGDTHKLYNVLRIEFMSARDMKKLGHDTKGHPYFMHIVVANEFTEGIDDYFFPVDDVELG